MRQKGGGSMQREWEVNVGRGQHEGGSEGEEDMCRYERR